MDSAREAVARARQARTATARAAVASEAIARIDRWLASHAPLAHAALRPPATDADLAAVEAELGRPIPLDLRAWWTYANGVDRNAHHGPALIPSFYWPIATHESLAGRRMFMELAGLVTGLAAAERDAYLAEQDALPAGTSCQVWLPGWLPIASDVSSGRMFVDLRDGDQHGCVTEYAVVGGSWPRPEWWDVAGMLFDIAERLDDEEIEFEDDGRMRWR